jgi:hypothetical protein
MKIIKDIMTILKCSEQQAFAVFNRMSMNGLDFSECTKTQFKRAALQAAKEV